MKSKIANDLTFRPDQGVVSLVRSYEHVIILLERQTESGNYELRKIDFKPRAMVTGCCSRFYWTDGYQSFFSGHRVGFIVNREFYGKDGKTVDDYDREMIFKQLVLNNESFSWLCDMVSIKKMMDFIQEEQNNLPGFNVRARFGDKETYSCCTWAVERLHMIDGIDDAGRFFHTILGARYMRFPESGSHSQERIDNNEDVNFEVRF